MKSPLANMSLRTKLWLGLGGLFFILLLGSAISAIVLSVFSGELQRLLRENYDSEIYCNQMIDALDRLDVESLRMCSDLDTGAAGFAEQSRRFEKNLSLQFHNISLPGERAMTVRLQNDWHDCRRLLERLAAAPQDACRTFYASELQPAFARARASAARVGQLNMNNVVSADGRVRATMVGVRDVLWMLVGAGAFLAIIILTATGTRLLQPLRELTGFARHIGAGELDMKVPVRSNDEVGELAMAFNLMAQRLREYRKSDHQRLQRAQNTTQLAIDSLTDAVIVLSPEGIVEISNLTARTHFKAEPGLKVQDLGLEWLATLHDRVRRDVHASEPAGYASAIQLFDHGHERFLLPRGVPMIDNAGHLVGVTLILADVTALRRADEFKSGLVSTVSHELRTPLTSLRMSTMLLADETLGPLNSRQMKLAGAARDESERLYRIIESLLEFSRANAKAGNLTVRPIVVQRAIAAAVKPLESSFADKGVTLVVCCDAALNVLADADSVSIVVSNLLTNALKFTPAGGKVSVATTTTAEGVTIQVSDNGVGIPPEFSQRIFERFFRVPGSSVPPGTGLGLPIARQIVEALGGALDYRPREGGGSEFYFTLIRAGESSHARPSA